MTDTQFKVVFRFLISPCIHLIHTIFLYLYSQLLVFVPTAIRTVSGSLSLPASVYCVYSPNKHFITCGGWLIVLLVDFVIGVNMDPSKIFVFLLAAKIILLVSAYNEDYRLYLEHFALPNFYDVSDYNVNLHLNHELFTSNSTQFSGEVQIHFISKNISDKIVLHSHHDMIKLNKITFENVEIPSSNYSVNNLTDLLTIYTENHLTPDTSYILVIEYTGTITTEGLAGLYRSSYVHKNGETKYLLATQLAPTNARKVFPCFDEPDYKAHFNFTVTFPSNLHVFFNALERRRSHDANTSMITVDFHKTPKMPTYLLALVIADFTCSYTDIEIIPLRICTRPEFEPKRQLAFDITPKLLAILNNFTNYDYDLHLIGKLDLIAVPDFPPFTMENWGLIMHREIDLLYDKDETPNAYKERIMKAIAHALAHQWFGNLVSFHWWADTYMNEGLATYFQYYVLSQVLPHYEVEKRFVMDMLHDVLVEDARGLEIFSLGLSGIETTAEIEYAFSEVSYQKGSSIIRMVSHLMSLENFRTGIQNYINKYEFGNAYIEDLWAELNKTIQDSVSKMPANLSTVMKNWIWDEGYPLVTVSVNENILTVSQSPFWYSRQEDETKWYIPISYTLSTHKLKFQSTTPDFWLTPDSDYHGYFPPETDWIILNNQQTGYYRVNYDTTLWAKIKAALQKENFDGIIDINRAQIVDDLFNFARANLLKHSFVLDTIRFLKDDISYYPWRAAVEDFGTILRRVGDNSDLGKAIRSDVLNLIDKFYKSVPISIINRDDHFYTLKQVLAVDWACRLGHQDCIKEAVSMFNLYKTSGERPVLELRSNIYCNGLRYSEDDSDWYFMWNAYLKAENQPSEQDIIRRVLGCSKNKTLLKNYLHKTITRDSGIRSQDALTVFNSVKINPEGIDVAFNFIIENQEAIVEHYQDTGTIELILLGTALRLTSEEQIKRLTELVNNGRLKKGFKEYGRRAKLVANITASWRNKYSEDLAAYYNKTDRSSLYLYLLLIIIPICMLLVCKYQWNRTSRCLSDWFGDMIPADIRGRYQRQSMDDIVMLDQ